MSIPFKKVADGEEAAELVPIVVEIVQVHVPLVRVLVEIRDVPVPVRIRPDRAANAQRIVHATAARPAPPVSRLYRIREHHSTNTLHQVSSGKGLFVCMLTQGSTRHDSSRTRHPEFNRA